MKIIEEPAFQLENSVAFDALVEREMESLEGGFCSPIVGCIGFCNVNNSSVTTTSSSSPSTTTT